LAERLNYAFLDTGAMYRAATWRALQHHVGLADREALIASTRQMQLEMRDGHIYVDGQDVTEAIRLPEVTRTIRALDGIPEVREHLGSLQREFGASRPTVAEGRDMGTVVFPDAECKVYLDAGLDERARRRAREIERNGTSINEQDVRTEIAARDTNDQTRATAPLKAADDAHVIDSTGLSIDEVVDQIVELVRERRNAG
jgi:cytidylate kinase